LSREEARAHVHVQHVDGEAKFWIRSSSFWRRLLVSLSLRDQRSDITGSPRATVSSDTWR
jgi:hypothetical protein